LLRIPWGEEKQFQDGRGPILLDTITYRFSGHSPSDASSYREKDEIESWQQQDAIISYAQYLVDNNHSSRDDQVTWQLKIRSLMKRAMELSTSLEISPRISLQVDAIGGLMFSNGNVERMEHREPMVLMTKEDNPRLKSNKRKSRSAFKNGKDGELLSTAKIIAYRDALFEAMLHRFYIDPTMIAYGEENRDWGGAFAVYRGLTEALPYHRLFNSPISEGAMWVRLWGMHSPADG